MSATKEINSIIKKENDLFIAVATNMKMQQSDVLFTDEMLEVLKLYPEHEFNFTYHSEKQNIKIKIKVISKPFKKITT